MNRFRSAAGAARNHGAAGTGTEEFIRERFTALVLILLGLVLGAKAVLLSAGGIDLAEARAWLGDPLNAGLVLAFVLFGMNHAFIAGKVLLEDYIHVTGLKILLVTCHALLTTTVALVAIVAVTRALFQAVIG